MLTSAAPITATSGAVALVIDPDTHMDKPKRRELSGICCVVEREGKTLSLDLTDLTETELYRILKSQSETGLQRYIHTLCNSINKLADQYDIPLKKGRETFAQPTLEDLREDTIIFERMTFLRNKKDRTAEEDRELERISGIYYGRNWWIRESFEANNHTNNKLDFGLNDI